MSASHIHLSVHECLCSDADIPIFESICQFIAIMNRQRLAGLYFNGRYPPLRECWSLLQVPKRKNHFVFCQDKHSCSSDRFFLVIGAHKRSKIMFANQHSSHRFRLFHIELFPVHEIQNENGINRFVCRRM